MFDSARLAKELTSREFHLAVVMYWTERCRDLVQRRDNVSREDLEYFASRASKMKDERLAQIAAALIGWGDDEHAELEVFCAIALQVMQDTSPSRLREAALKVNLRQILGELNEQKQG